MPTTRCAAFACAGSSVGGHEQPAKSRADRPLPGRARGARAGAGGHHPGRARSAPGARPVVAARGRPPHRRQRDHCRHPAAPPAGRGEAGHPGVRRDGVLAAPALLRPPAGAVAGRGAGGAGDQRRHPVPAGRVGVGARGDAHRERPLLGRRLAPHLRRPLPRPRRADSEGAGRLAVTGMRGTGRRDVVTGAPMPRSPYLPGDKTSFDALYRETYTRVFRTLLSSTGDRAAAEDCAQDAFLQAFKAWKKWKQDAPAEAWVHRIAINTAISYRRKQRLREVGELIRRLGRPVAADPKTHTLDSDLLRELRRLPAKQAAVIVLRHLHGYTNREIAAALGVPESTIATRLMVAKRTLRARLGGAREPITDTSSPPRVPPIE